MKIFVGATLLCAVVFFGVAGTHAAEIEGVEVYVNGEEVERKINVGFGVTVDIGTMAQLLSEGDEIVIRVIVKGRNERVWVGATLSNGQGDEQDLAAREVGFEGSGTKSRGLVCTLKDSLEDPVNWNEDGIHYTVALWRERVRDDSHPLGYALRGQVDSINWHLLGFYINPPW